MTSSRIAAFPVAHIRLSGPLTGEVLLQAFAPLLDDAVDRSCAPVVVSCSASARLRPTGTGVLFRTVLDLFARKSHRLLVVVGAPEPLRMTLAGVLRQLDQGRHTYFVDAWDAADAILRLHAHADASPTPFHPAASADRGPLPVAAVAA